MSLTLSLSRRRRRALGRPSIRPPPVPDALRTHLRSERFAPLATVAALPAGAARRVEQPVRRQDARTGRSRGAVPGHRRDGHAAPAVPTAHRGRLLPRPLPRLLRARRLRARPLRRAVQGVQRRDALRVRGPRPGWAGRPRSGEERDRGGEGARPEADEETGEPRAGTLRTPYASGAIDDTTYLAPPAPAITPVAAPARPRQPRASGRGGGAAGAGRGTGRVARPLPSTPSSRRRWRRASSRASRSPWSRTARSSSPRATASPTSRSRSKATEQTVYQLASVTKPFTAMAILMLVEDGKLSLDGKVTEILPGLPAAWAPVTVRHLLSHTSGIKSYTDVFGEKKVPDSQVFTADEILALVKDAPLQFTPGEKFAYCNTGYYLLGMIVEKASGKPYGDVRRRADLQAAGHDRRRRSTTTPTRGPCGPGATARRTARPSRPSTRTRRSRSRPARSSRPSSTWRSGTPRSTARKLLKPASYDAMWTPMRFNDGKASTYALGWAGRAVPRPGRARRTAAASAASRRSSPASPTTRSRSSRSSTRAAGPAGALVNGIAEIYVPALKDDGAEADRRHRSRRPRPSSRQVLTLGRQGRAPTRNG